MADFDYREATRRGYRAAIRRVAEQGNRPLAEKLGRALVELECLWDEDDRGRGDAA